MRREAAQSLEFMSGVRHNLTTQLNGLQAQVNRLTSKVEALKRIKMKASSTEAETARAVARVGDLQLYNE